jgi:hypothetical protein
MKKRVIGLDIDEIFRSYIETFHYFYEKEFDLKKYDKSGTQIDGYNCEYNTTNLIDIFEFKDKVKKTRVLVSDIDVAYSSHPKFEDETTEISKNMALNIFRYEDYLMELYGTCPKVYTNVGLDLARLVDKFKDSIEFKFIVKDKTITIGPTLFFISTLRPTIKSYEFVNSIDDVWNLCDIYVTANPDYINNNKNGNEVILKTMPYNKKYIVDNRIDSLNDLLNNKIIENIIRND